MSTTNQVIGIFFRNQHKFSDLVEQFKFEMYDVIIKLGDSNMILRQGQKVKLDGEEVYCFLCAGHRFTKGSKRPAAIVIKLSNSSPELITDFATVNPVYPIEIADISLEQLKNLMDAFLIKFPPITQRQVREMPKRSTKCKDPDFVLKAEAKSIKPKFSNSSSSSLEEKQEKKKKKHLKKKAEKTDWFLFRFYRNCGK